MSVRFWGGGVFNGYLNIWVRCRFSFDQEDLESLRVQEKGFQQFELNLKSLYQVFFFILRNKVFVEKIEFSGFGF